MTASIIHIHKRRKTMTLCRSRGEAWKSEAQRRTVSRRSLALGSALAFPLALDALLQFAGRSQARAYCLALEGPPLDRPYAQTII